MVKKTVTLDSNWIGGTKGKVLGGVVVALLLAVIAFNVGDSGGYKRGYGDGLDKGNHAGFTRGDQAGFEKGYWTGREDGCLWVFDQTGKPYVVGEGNPFTTWYYLMDIGNIYLGRSNCSTSGHGAAPYSPSDYVPAVDGSTN